ncbi:MarR family winged helix-turn-helix transcriptional regulator [Parahaliea mediterranea]|uniref:MarR family winged helix-turn-helix transcriptional regulator n=1 Tax=Parahaliea mediterranea TaxID=651086 RepID=UPI000E2E6106|nr:MarR family transcriptional regulator [Parahaliea mediterranea]
MTKDKLPEIPPELEFLTAQHDLFSAPFYLMAHADFYYHEDLDRAAARLGLDRTAYRILTTLHRQSPINIKELSRNALIKRSTTTRALARLREAGYVSQQVDAADSRLVNVALTEQGKVVAQRIIELGDRQLQRAVQGISEERLRELTHTLREIVINLNKLPIE